MVSICNLVLSMLIQRSLARLECSGVCLPNDGNYANLPEFNQIPPYQVSVRPSKYKDEIFPYFCSGAIISCNWIITAAQCLGMGSFPLRDSELTVIAGEKTRYEAGDVKNHPSETRQIRHVKVTSDTVRVHPSRYDAYNETNDIAALRVDCPFDFDQTVKPVALPESALDNSTDVLLSGWGTVERRNTYGGDIKLIHVKRAVCDKPEYNTGGKIFCSAGTSSKNNTYNVECAADGGSPAVIHATDDNPNAVLAGITSFTYYNASAQGYPFFSNSGCQLGTASQIGYVNVFAHRSWIKDQIHSDDCNTLPMSMNGKTHGDGCPGAVWSDGKPSKPYCDGEDHEKRPVFKWWQHCCKWEWNEEKEKHSCVPKGTS